MSITKAWLDDLKTMGEQEQLDAVRGAAAALYRDTHGRDPRDAAERSEALQLLAAATDALKASGNGSGSEPLNLEDLFPPVTLAMRRAWDEEQFEAERAEVRARGGWI